MGNKRLRLVSFSALAAALFLSPSSALRGLLSPGSLAPAPAILLGADATPPETASLKWYGLEEGVSRVRKQYLSALVLYRPSAPSPLGEAPAAEENGEARGAGGAGDEFFADVLADASSKKILKQFVLIRLERADLERVYPLPRKPPAPGKAGANAAGGAETQTPAPAVAEVLDLRGDRSAVVLLDFRERIVKRYDDDVQAGADADAAAVAGRSNTGLPKISQLKAELDRIWKVNKVFATKAREVEPLLEKSLYSFRAGEARAAVLLVLPLEDKGAQARMDPVLLERLKKLIDEYRAKAEEGMSKADRLDKEKKYAEAIEAFDRVMKEYPFKDIAIRAAQRKGQILRKLTFGGGP